jgi:hypothetical protein
MAVVKIPIGPELGTAITDCTVAQLEAACEKAEADICAVKETSHKARKLKQFVAAARLLLRQRKFPTGSYSVTEDANRALRDAAEVGHLVSPSQQVARVLDGTVIMVSAFRADVALDTFEDDEDRTKRIPNKALIDRVANELGLSWMADQCRRMDGANPQAYVRSFQAAGKVKNFDGSEREFQGTAEIDLTEGSGLHRKIVARYGDKARVELERRRQYILSHVDTTARLRAIKQIGLRDSYAVTDLGKPFFTARVVFTGQTESPEAKAFFDGKIAERFLPAVDAVFGSKKAAGER